MRITGLSYPITSYVIPPAAPTEVAEAWGELQRVGNLCEDAKDDLSDARERLAAAKAADVQAIVTATNEGGEVEEPQKHEREALADISRLQAQLRGLQQAADEAGNALAEQIEKHRDEWQDALDESRDTAGARYDAALADAKAALTELIPAQAGVTWVQDFDANQARTGRYAPFAGGRLRVSGRGAGVSDLRKDYDPAALLHIASLATAEPKREVVNV